MIRITVEYSGDFKEDRKASEVCGILECEGFYPIDIFSRHDPGCGRGKCVYIFEEKTELPTQEKLKEMLKDVGLTGIIEEYF